MRTADHDGDLGDFVVAGAQDVAALDLLEVGLERRGLGQVALPALHRQQRFLDAVRNQTGFAHPQAVPLEVPVCIVVAFNQFVRLRVHDLLHFVVDEVVLRVDVLFHQSSDFEVFGDEFIFVS